MQNLDIYLNDHLAGSVAALELLDHLIQTSDDSTLREFLKTLHDEIAADQTELANLLRQLGHEESTMRKAGAWLLEKMSRAKLQVGADDHDLSLFQALEGLSLGITGKRSLWRSLAVSAAANPALRALDYTRLEQRAIEQYEQVEARCLELAPSVFKPR
jgi:hypothetical protein